MLNVLTGKRYGVVPKEIKDYVRGYYGRPPAPIDPEVKKLIIGDEEPITCRPADLMEPRIDAARNELAEKGFGQLTEEDILSYILFPEVALAFFSHRAGQ